MLRPPIQEQGDPLCWGARARQDPQGHATPQKEEAVTALGIPPLSLEPPRKRGSHGEGVSPPWGSCKAQEPPKREGYHGPRGPNEPGTAGVGVPQLWGCRDGAGWRCLWSRGSHRAQHPQEGGSYGGGRPGPGGPGEPRPPRGRRGGGCPGYLATASSCSLRRRRCRGGPSGPGAVVVVPEGVPKARAYSTRQGAGRGGSGPPSASSTNARTMATPPRPRPAARHVGAGRLRPPSAPPPVAIGQRACRRPCSDWGGAQEGSGWPMRKRGGGGDWWVQRGREPGAHPLHRTTPGRDWPRRRRRHADWRIGGWWAG